MTGIPKQRGHPAKKEIDWKLFENLCRIHCTESEICAIFGITEKTLAARCKETFEKPFSQVFAEKRAGGKMSIRRRQYETAMGRPARYDEQGNLLEAEAPPDRTMLIWLGKQWLGQSDKRGAFGKDGEEITSYEVRIVDSQGNAKPIDDISDEDE